MNLLGRRQKQWLRFLTADVVNSVDKFMQLVHPNDVSSVSRKDADWKNFKPRQEGCRGLEFLKRDLVILPTNRDGDVLLMSSPPTYSPKK